MRLAVVMLPQDHRRLKGEGKRGNWLQEPDQLVDWTSAHCLHPLFEVHCCEVGAGKD
jgi:hypothetical protein